MEALNCSETSLANQTQPEMPFDGTPVTLDAAQMALDTAQKALDAAQTQCCIVLGTMTAQTADESLLIQASEDESRRKAFDEQRQMAFKEKERQRAMEEYIKREKDLAMSKFDKDPWGQPKHTRRELHHKYTDVTQSYNNAQKELEDAMSKLNLLIGSGDAMNSLGPDEMQKVSILRQLISDLEPRVLRMEEDARKIGSEIAQYDNRFELALDEAVKRATSNAMNYVLKQEKIKEEQEAYKRARQAELSVEREAEHAKREAERLRIEGLTPDELYQEKLQEEEKRMRLLEVYQLKRDISNQLSSIKDFYEINKRRNAKLLKVLREMTDLSVKFQLAYQQMCSDDTNNLGELQQIGDQMRAHYRSMIPGDLVALTGSHSPATFEIGFIQASSKFEGWFTSSSMDDLDALFNHIKSVISSLTTQTTIAVPSEFEKACNIFEHEFLSKIQFADVSASFLEMIESYYANVLCEQERSAFAAVCRKCEFPIDFDDVNLEDQETDLETDQAKANEMNDHRFAFLNACIKIQYAFGWNIQNLSMVHDIFKIIQTLISSVPKMGIKSVKFLKAFNEFVCMFLQHNQDEYVEEKFQGMTDSFIYPKPKISEHEICHLITSLFQTILEKCAPVLREGSDFYQMNQDKVQAFRRNLATLAAEKSPTWLRILFQNGFYGSDADLAFKPKYYADPIMCTFFDKFSNTVYGAFNNKNIDVPHILREICNEALEMMMWVATNRPKFLLAINGSVCKKTCNGQCFPFQHFYPLQQYFPDNYKNYSYDYRVEVGNIPHWRDNRNMPPEFYQLDKFLSGDYNQEGIEFIQKLLTVAQWPLSVSGDEIDVKHIKLNWVLRDQVVCTYSAYKRLREGYRDFIVRENYPGVNWDNYTTLSSEEIRNIIYKRLRKILTEELPAEIARANHVDALLKARKSCETIPPSFEISMDQILAHMPPPDAIHPIGPISLNCEVVEKIALAVQNQNFPFDLYIAILGAAYDLRNSGLLGFINFSDQFLRNNCDREIMTDQLAKEFNTRFSKVLGIFKALVDLFRDAHRKINSSRSYFWICQYLTSIFEHIVDRLEPYIKIGTPIFEYRRLMITQCRNRLAHFAVSTYPPWLKIILAKGVYGLELDLEYTATQRRPIMNTFLGNLSFSGVEFQEEIIEVIRQISGTTPKFMRTVDCDGHLPFQCIHMLAGLFQSECDVKEAIQNPCISPLNYNWASVQNYGPEVIDYVRQLAVAAHNPIQTWLDEKEKVRDAFVSDLKYILETRQEVNRVGAFLNTIADNTASPALSVFVASQMNLIKEILESTEFAECQKRVVQCVNAFKKMKILPGEDSSNVFKDLTPEQTSLLLEIFHAQGVHDSDDDVPKFIDDENGYDFCSCYGYYANYDYGADDEETENFEDAMTIAGDDDATTVAGDEEVENFEDAQGDEEDDDAMTVAADEGDEGAMTVAGDDDAMTVAGDKEAENFEDAQGDEEDDDAMAVAGDEGAMAVAEEDEEDEEDDAMVIE